MAKKWMPVETSDGSRKGEYEVSGGMLTVKYQDRTKMARASSTAVPEKDGANADYSLARIILSEPFT